MTGPASKFSARFLLVLCLLASTLQGFIAQTHVHAVAAALTGVEAVHADPRLDSLVPAEPDCLLCDIAGHSPAAAPLSASVVTGLLDFAHATALPVVASSFASPASHHWHGRGPPSV